MGSSSQQPVTQQTAASKDPWAPAQPYLQKAMGRAGSFFDDNVGYQPYSGQTQAPLDPNLQGGLNSLSSLYSADLGGSPGVNAARDFGTSLISMGGINPQQQGYINQLGNQLGIYGQIDQQAAGQENPYLQATIDANNRRIADKVNSSVSGAGRYGSAAHTDVLGRSLAEAADPILAQDYTQRQQTRLAAQQGFGQTSQAALGALQQGQNAAGQWAQLMPALDQARLAGAQGLAGVGQFSQERAQSQLNDQIKLYNAQQSYPWEQLLRMNAVAGGAGALGGTQTGTQTTPINQPSTLQKLFGGAAAGAGIGGSFGGPVGGAAGAGIGGLLGLL